MRELEVNILNYSHEDLREAPIISLFYTIFEIIQHWLFLQLASL